MMITLVKHGDSLALILDPSILDQLSIAVDTPLDIAVEGTHLIVTPITPERRAKFEAAAKDTMER